MPAKSQESAENAVITPNKLLIEKKASFISSIQRSVTAMHYVYVCVFLVTYQHHELLCE